MMPVENESLWQNKAMRDPDEETKIFRDPDGVGA
jgi:hypothetical protein